MPENTQTIAIPDKYAKLGATSGFLPSTADSLNIVVEARHGDGKSTFTSSDPDALVLDFDKAANNVFGRRAWSVPINSWDEYVSVKTALIDDAKAGKRPKKRLVFDTVDAWLSMIDENCLEERRKRSDPSARVHQINTITEFGESGAGYKILRAALLHEIKAFEAAGYKYTACCQLKVKTEQQEIDGKMRPVEVKYALMPPTMIDLLVMQADLAGVIYSKTVTEPVMVKKVIGGREQTFKSGDRTVKKYIMEVTENGDVGDQKRRLLGFDQSVELPPVDGWAEFSRIYAEQIAKLKSNAAAQTATNQ